MNQILNKFHTEYYLKIEQLDNFSLEKNPLKQNDNKDAMLFSSFICKNKKFNQKLLLNFFPDLVIESLEEEFGRNLNSELIDILIKEFNIKAFEDFTSIKINKDNISCADPNSINSFIEIDCHEPSYNSHLKTM